MAIAQKSQLTLNLRPLKKYNFDRFDFSSSPSVKLLLFEWLSAPKQQLLIQGPKGSGKSHLLQAAANRAEENGLSVGFLDAKEMLSAGFAQIDNDALSGYEYFDLLIIDDIDMLCADPKWSHALFNLYNHHQDQDLGLLMSSSITPHNMKYSLADMVSRLQMALMLTINPLDDNTRKTQLLLKAHDLGFVMNDEIARYICLRAPRDMGSLMHVLNLLDSASWENKRKLTIPFIKQVMHW